jgi:hypothetical protein
VRKGLVGTDCATDAAVITEPFFAVLGDLFEAWTVLLLAGSNKITMLGRKSKTLSSTGAELYAVMANRIAQTLSRKSVMNAVNVYGVKNLLLA